RPLWRRSSVGWPHDEGSNARFWRSPTPSWCVCFIYSSAMSPLGNSAPPLVTGSGRDRGSSVSHGAWSSWGLRSTSNPVRQLRRRFARASEGMWHYSPLPQFRLDRDRCGITDSFGRIEDDGFAFRETGAHLGRDAVVVGDVDFPLARFAV